MLILDILLVHPDRVLSAAKQSFDLEPAVDRTDKKIRMNITWL